MARTRQQPTFRARPTFKVHLVPRWVAQMFNVKGLRPVRDLLMWLHRSFYYERRYTVNLRRNGGGAGFSSDGFKLWRLKINRTTGYATFDTPGMGAVHNIYMPRWVRAFIFSPTRHED